MPFGCFSVDLIAYLYAEYAFHFVLPPTFPSAVHRIFAESSSSPVSTGTNKEIKDSLQK